MFGKQLERVKKRIRDLKEQVEETERSEMDLAGRLQGELERFLEQNSNAKHVETSSKGLLIIYLPQQVKLQCTGASDSVVIYVNGDVASRYYHKERRFFESIGHTQLPDHIQGWVRHIFVDLMSLWDHAVATRDYESFECTRILRWIAQQLPRDTQWPDIISGIKIK